MCVAYIGRARGPIKILLLPTRVFTHATSKKKGRPQLLESNLKIPRAFVRSYIHGCRHCACRVMSGLSLCTSVRLGPRPLLNYGAIRPDLVSPPGALAHPSSPIVLLQQSPSCTSSDLIRNPRRCAARACCESEL